VGTHMDSYYDPFSDFIPLNMVQDFIIDGFTNDETEDMDDPTFDMMSDLDEDDPDDF